MKTITVNDKDYSFVTSYTEMDTDQFLQICFIYSNFLNRTTVEEYNAHRIAAFQVLTKVPYKIIVNISAQEWVDILPYVDFVFETAPNLDKNLIPVLKTGSFHRKLYGPEGLLNNISVYEMMEADTAFISAANFKNVEKMYLLASIIYRPKRRDLRKFRKSDKWNNDIREPYNSAKAKDRLKQIERLPFFQIAAIYIYYWSFREKELVNNPILEKIFKGKGKNMGLEIGWLSTLLEVSNNTFGNLEETKDHNWKLVLVKIANDLTKAENRDKASKEARIRAGFKS